MRPRDSGANEHLVQNFVAFHISGDHPVSFLEKRWVRDEFEGRKTALRCVVGARLAEVPVAGVVLVPMASLTGFHANHVHQPKPTWEMFVFFALYNAGLFQDPGFR